MGHNCFNFASSHFSHTICIFWVGQWICTVVTNTYNIMWADETEFRTWLISLMKLGLSSMGLHDRDHLIHQIDHICRCIYKQLWYLQTTYGFLYVYIYVYIWSDRSHRLVYRHKLLIINVGVHTIMANLFRVKQDHFCNLESIIFVKYVL